MSNEIVPVKEVVAVEDRLSVENSYLKITNLALQRTLLQRDLVKAETELAALQAKLAKDKLELEKKYSIDLSKDKIAEDGTITRG